MANNMAARWLTGIILALVIILVIVVAPPLALTALIALAAAGGTWEYNNIVLGKDFFKEKLEGIAFSFLIPFVTFFGTSQLVLAVLAFCVLVTFILFLSSVRDSNFDVTVVAKVTFGIFYIPFLLSYFILLRTANQGVLWVLFVLVLAFAGDTAALYTGKYFGKHKLSPIVSPGKTVEGTIGLILGSMAACLIYSYLLFPSLSLVKIAILAFFGSIIGQLGDLCESAIKRNYGFKDAGSLLPGHGGLMDRLDCLLFIVPFVYYYRIYLFD